jgi:hypothetical protein
MYFVPTNKDIDGDLLNCKIRKYLCPQLKKVSNYLNSCYLFMVQEHAWPGVTKRCHLSWRTKCGGGGLRSLSHRVHKGRDEIGYVYLPSQLERTLQLCTRWPGLIFSSWWNVRQKAAVNTLCALCGLSRWVQLCAWSPSTAQLNFGDLTPGGDSNHEISVIHMLGHPLYTC